MYVYSYIFVCIVLRSLKLPGATTFPNYNVMLFPKTVSEMRNML